MLALLLFAMPWSAANEFDAYVRKAEAEPVMTAGATVEVKGGLIHDWSAEAFVKDRTPEQVIRVLQSYARYQDIYPEVTASRLLSKDGNRFRAALQLKRKKILTVILNTEYDVEYQPLGEGRWRVASRSTKVEEADGGDNGYLWRLNAYWMITAEPGGVRLQCRSVSLTRGIPMGLGWAVKPLLREMPQESLAGMLSATVMALQ